MNNLGELLDGWSGRRVLVVVFPHPDDESAAAGGLLIAARARGFQTAAICLTAGGAGRVHVNLSGRSLGQARREEFLRATERLGVSTAVLGPFEDGKLSTHEQDYSRWLCRELYRLRPGIIVTYDHSGLSGHPDHISLSRAVKNIVRAWRGPGRPGLFWSTIPPGPVFDRFVDGRVKDLVTRPDYVLDLGLSVLSKWRALRAHRSQGHGRGLPIPLLLAMLLYGRREWYHEVKLNKDYPYRKIAFEF